MSYIHHQIGVTMLRATPATSMITNTVEKWSATSTGVKAVYGAGYQPFVVRAVAVQKVGTAATTTATVVSFRKGTTGSAVGTSGLITTVTVATAAVQGKVYYKDGLRSEVIPGQEVQANVTTASAGGKLRAYLFIEPRWEVPGNNSNMVASA